MRVVGLDGRVYSLKLRRSRREQCSAGHVAARLLLARLLPFDPAYEEVFLPGCGLYLDFLVPTRCLAVEVQGIQHRQPGAFGRGLPTLRAQQGRDSRKAEWCRRNGFTLVELHDHERDGWENQLGGVLAGQIPEAL